MSIYWWDFIDNGNFIIVQSRKNVEIKRFLSNHAGQEQARKLVDDLESGRIRLTSKDEIKE